ncbi:hypothetical protein BDFB_012042 [Asbolus verrucosus]|uniref:Uncharacterized protein n=1 Tax=Asbolus verrucosus TaxID=1661398 RepID=A0A482VM78_ASBVE|nr:hypothetical protein BDFB_012042 [Asbolus verrucosus]
MGTIQTRLRIVNNTDTDIVNTSVSGINEHDWDEYFRPDNNFSGIFIESKTFVERREELKPNASRCAFTMTLTFQDGSVDTFVMHQKYAIDCCPGFLHIAKSHNIFYERDNENLLKITVENTREQLEQKRKAEKDKKMKEDFCN